MARFLQSIAAGAVEGESSLKWNTVDSPLAHEPNQFIPPTDFLFEREHCDSGLRDMHENRLAWVTTS